jgi:hypothetical protein
MLSDKRTTTTTATERLIVTTVVGMLATDVVLMNRATIKKSTKERTTIFDVAYLIETSTTTLTSTSMIEQHTRISIVSSTTPYTAC